MKYEKQCINRNIPQLCCPYLIDNIAICQINLFGTVHLHHLLPSARPFITTSRRSIDPQTKEVC